jgi:hypothetical protein
LLQSFPPIARGILVVVLVLVAGYAAWQELRPVPFPVVVLAGNATSRRRWRRRLGDTVRRLQRLVGPPPGADLALLLVEWLPEGQRATCVAIRRRSDGQTIRLLCLALSVPERRLTPDEVLAALAEQYLACAQIAKARTARAPATTAAPAADQLGALLTDLGITANGTPHHP